MNAVEMKNITMIFNQNVIANKNINFTVKKGEIHALIGENGAGKSTLMSILFGIYNPTNGTVFINEKEENISNPIKASQLGIGMVHQHFKLIDIFPVWKNIALGNEDVNLKQFLNKKKIIKELEVIMEQYDLYVDLNAKVQNISVGMKQRVEILKILYRQAEILVFDEPTAVLTPQEIDGLLKVLIFLKSKNKTIILITHKMHEIKAVADTATVIRLGENTGTFNVKKTSVLKLSQAMVGRDLVEIKNQHTDEISDKNVLEVKMITVSKKSNHKILALKDFSLNIKAGEILGVAGVEGNGQSELAEVLSGMLKPSKGQIILNNQNITKASIEKRLNKFKISHIPEDRQKYGLVMDADLITNTAIQSVSTRKFSKYGFVNKKQMQLATQKIIEKFDVRNAGAGTTVSRSLSGGNQQKFIVGREMSKDSDLIIIVQPTRGLDVGSIEFIHNQILKAKKQGTAILLISYELSEIIQLSDRVVVMNSGEIVGELTGQNIKRSEIGYLMVSKKEVKNVRN